MLTNLRVAIHRRYDEEGATAVEYGIMVALIAVVIIFAVWFIGQQLQETFSCVGSALEDPDGLPTC